MRVNMIWRQQGVPLSSSGLWYRDSGMKFNIVGVFAFEANKQQLISLFLAPEWCRAAPLRPRGDNVWSIDPARPRHVYSPSLCDAPIAGNANGCRERQANMLDFFSSISLNLDKEKLYK